MQSCTTVDALAPRSAACAAPPDLCTSLMCCPRGLQDYARRRVAFGRPLVQQPLALCTLAWLELRCCGSLALTLEVARLLGGCRRCRCRCRCCCQPELLIVQAPLQPYCITATLCGSFYNHCTVPHDAKPEVLVTRPTLPPAGLHEAGQASAADAAMLRLLTPLAKLFTAKLAVEVCSEGVSAALASCGLGGSQKTRKKTSLVGRAGQEHTRLLDCYSLRPNSGRGTSKTPKAEY